MTLPVRRSTDVDTWNPFRELDDFHQRMSGLLESTLGDGRLATLTGWVPAVDVEETDESFVVEAELPGVKRDDITVEVRDRELAIHGDVLERERAGILRRKARRTGRFDYRVVLPGEVGAHDVTANLEDGVLRVVVPKAAQAKPRRVEITAA